MYIAKDKFNYMRNFFLLVLLAFTISCSEDDSSGSASEKELDVVTSYTYFYTDTGTFSQKRVTEFIHNKPVKTTSYNGSGQALTYADYIYSASGLLSSIKEYNIQQNTISSDVSISYDGARRIKKIVSTYFSNSTFLTEKIFNYSGNTISSGGYTYYLNEDGLIYKEVNPWGGIKEKVFNNNNIVSLTLEGSVTHYSYYTDLLPKGPYLNINSGKFGSYKANADLFGGFLGHINPTDNYISTISNTTTNSNFEYNYEFDDEGYPFIVSYTDLNLGRILSLNVINYKQQL